MLLVVLVMLMMLMLAMLMVMVMAAMLARSPIARPLEAAHLPSNQ